MSEKVSFLKRIGEGLSSYAFGPSKKEIAWANRVASGNISEGDVDWFSAKRSVEISLSLGSSERTSKAIDLYNGHASNITSGGDIFGLQPELDAINSREPERILPFMQARANQTLERSKPRTAK